MAQTLKQRRRKQTRPNSPGRNLAFLALAVLGSLGAIYYVFPAITSGDWRWFSTEFSEQPREIAIVDRGQRTVLTAGDPRFAPLVSAFNQSIERGYRSRSGGMSDETRARMEQNGLYVEASYAEPVSLHLRGGFYPTRKLRIVIGGKDLYLNEALFRTNPNGLDPLYLMMTTTEPLQQALGQLGYRLVSSA